MLSSRTRRPEGTFRFDSLKGMSNDCFAGSEVIVLLKEDPQIVGALGAAILARQKWEKKAV